MSDNNRAFPKENSTIDLQYAFYMVDEKPYCLWDIDIKSITLEYLENVDPTYFEYVANTHLGEAVDEKSLLAALVLRSIYSHALETFFAFIAAALQAPQCVPAWIATYWPEDLKKVVSKVTHKQPIYTLLKPEKLSWQDVSEFIFTSLVLGEKDKEKQIKVDFANLWANFATDFLDDELRDEYNSIKHGLRVRPGGFHIAIGTTDERGTPDPPKRMQLLGKSEYGSSYFVSDKLLGTAYHFRLKRQYRNWNPEDFVWGLHLVSMSIRNVVSALKIINGVPAEDVRFSWPSETGTLGEPWKRTTKMGVRSMTVAQRTIPEELLKPYTRQEIKSEYLKGKHLGGIRYHIPQEPE